MTADGRPVQVNGISLHVAEQGAGSPVVLISPGDSPVYSWHNQLSALAAAGHSVYVVDLPGQGCTVLHDSSFAGDGTDAGLREALTTWFGNEVL